MRFFHSLLISYLQKLMGYLANNRYNSQLINCGVIDDVSQGAVTYMCFFLNCLGMIDKQTRIRVAYV